jgi:hypothetical protein
MGLKKKLGMVFAIGRATNLQHALCYRQCLCKALLRVVQPLQRRHAVQRMGIPLAEQSALRFQRLKEEWLSFSVSLRLQVEARQIPLCPQASPVLLSEVALRPLN